MAGLALRLSIWLERALVKVVLDLTLWPLKLLYKRPEPTWSAWYANQRLCQLNQRYC